MIHETTEDYLKHLSAQIKRKTTYLNRQFDPERDGSRIDRLVYISNAIQNGRWGGDMPRSLIELRATLLGYHHLIDEAHGTAEVPSSGRGLVTSRKPEPYCSPSRKPSQIIEQEAGRIFGMAGCELYSDAITNMHRLDPEVMRKLSAAMKGAADRIGSLIPHFQIIYAQQVGGDE